MKKYIFINTIGIFLLSSLCHFGYDVFPNVITSILCPINESIFEHQKMIITSVLIWNIIEYFIYKSRKLNTNNMIFSAWLSSIINIVIFLIIYLPIYYLAGEKMVLTLIIYFISILIAQIIITRINKSFKNNNLNMLGLILIIITYVITSYFTYNPIIGDFFLDKAQNKYGFDILK